MAPSSSSELVGITVQ
ncbi:hypothetical protein [Escherichia coli]